MNNGTTTPLFTFSFLLLTFFAGCDYADRKDLRNERDDRNYRAAMADYQAGRIDAAIEGFRKAVSEDPANAGARFQLACLLDDVKKDYAGAFCAYSEYVSQHPESDKAKTAKERLASCEKALAVTLAAKYSLSGEEMKRSLDEVRARLKGAEDRRVQLEKELKAVRDRSMQLAAERERMLAAVNDVGEREAEAMAPVVAKDVATEAKRLLEEAEEEAETDRGKLSKDVAELRADEKEESESQSTILPQQAADAKANREKLAAQREQAKRDAEERELRRHPPTYVVQEGDTLYRLAERFYGRITAWKVIRDANRAVISNDGRLKSGTTLTLPYGVESVKPVR